ncbi:MAG: hypothetical protein ACM3PP_01880 [Candidatus Saccharibacteria bacterium]
MEIDFVLDRSHYARGELYTAIHDPSMYINILINLILTSTLFYFIGVKPKVIGFIEIIILVFYSYLRLFSGYSIRKDQLDRIAKRSVAISPAGFIYRMNHSIFYCTWDKVTLVAQDSINLYFFSGLGHTHVVPRSAFQNQEEVYKFLDKIDLFRLSRIETNKDLAVIMPEVLSVTEDLPNLEGPDVVYKKDHYDYISARNFELKYLRLPPWAFKVDLILLFFVSVFCYEDLKMGWSSAQYLISFYITLSCLVIWWFIRRRHTYRRFLPLSYWSFNINTLVNALWNSSGYLACVVYYLFTKNLLMALVIAFCIEIIWDFAERIEIIVSNRQSVLALGRRRVVFGRDGIITITAKSMLYLPGMHRLGLAVHDQYLLTYGANGVVHVIPREAFISINDFYEFYRRVKIVRDEAIERLE